MYPYTIWITKLKLLSGVVDEPNSIHPVSYLPIMDMVFPLTKKKIYGVDHFVVIT
jgi:hypothetical protein